MDIETFMQIYKRAWENADEELLCALFEPDGRYHYTPFEIWTGHDAIRRYWRRTQRTSIGARYEILQRRAGGGIAHWHTTFRESEGLQAVDGIVVVEFGESGLCRDFRIWWHSVVAVPSASMPVENPIRVNPLKQQWSSLAGVLRELYERNGVAEPRLNEDLKYLQMAFLNIDELWTRNLSAIAAGRAGKVKAVMLSEAPLFGDNGSYFYNPATPFTSFFWRNDAAAVCDVPKEDFPHDKPEVLERLADAGFLVLDLFPFAFCEGKTALTFNNLARDDYRYLFGQIIDIYCRPKRDRILAGNNAPVFMFRYQRLRERLGDLVADCLRPLDPGPDPGPDPDPPVSIHGNGMNLNRQLLQEICRRIR